MAVVAELADPSQGQSRPFLCLCFLRQSLVILYPMGQLGAHLGPRGAQYSPVLEMSNLLTKSIKEAAASRGKTAVSYVNDQTTSMVVDWLTSAIIPEFVETNACY